MSLFLAFLILISGISPSITALAKAQESAAYKSAPSTASLVSTVNRIVQAIPDAFTATVQVLAMAESARLAKVDSLPAVAAPPSGAKPDQQRQQSRLKQLRQLLQQRQQSRLNQLRQLLQQRQRHQLQQLRQQSQQSKQSQPSMPAAARQSGSSGGAAAGPQSPPTGPHPNPPLERGGNTVTPPESSADQLSRDVPRNVHTDQTPAITFPSRPSPNTKEEALELTRSHLLEDADLRKQVLESTDEKTASSGYELLMKDLADYSRVKNNLNEADNLHVKTSLAADLRGFIVREEERAETLGVSWSKRRAYLNQLRSQLDELEGKGKGLLEKIGDAVRNLTNTDTEESAVKIPQKPASFGFSDDPTPIRKIQNIELKQPSQPGPPPQLNVGPMLNFGPQKALAYTETQLPTLEDVRPDTAEALIDQTISDLASYLSHNPVAITNFVRNNITYEPYLGAKKGSIGCLRERVCNDVDTSSLLIALLRASGIPARYRHQMIYPSFEQMKALLGVEEPRTVLAAFTLNKHEVYVSSGQATGGNIATINLSGVTHFALEWTSVEAFYGYDERGGNIDNTISFSSATTITQVRDLVRNDPLKQWIPIDGVFKSVTRSTNEIVPDTAGLNPETFWFGFFQYQGQLSPLDKLRADLQSSTGKDIFTSTYQSAKTLVAETYSVLPPSLPYIVVATLEGNPAVNEPWSTIPNTHRQQVAVTLERESNQQVILQKTFFGSEINNIELDLLYEGATQTDKDVITNYGGLHATPSSLVSILPSLRSGSSAATGATPVQIGEALILRFALTFNGSTWYEDQKFSTAGNHEGIFISLSKVEADPSLDTNSAILLRGNVGLARTYLKTIEDHGQTLKKSFDIEYNALFSRAVVTQNRVLTRSNGIPTTFTFKGYTLDASTFITDYSNRGNYQTHRKDFRLLWPLDSSYHESQLFTAVAGLEGISTVKGLQYASARQNEYTLHTISTSRGNESVIDTLNLSANTKQNMHITVQSGGTIVTPDKPIGNGNWNGILYVALNADWTGNYAIGEQVVGNGGWTVDFFNAYPQSAYVKEYVNGVETWKVIFQDDLIKSGNCTLSESDYNAIIGSAGYREEYGQPCMRMGVKYGNHANYTSPAYVTDPEAFVSLVTVKAAKFYKANQYNFWTTTNEVAGKFNAYIAQKRSLPSGHLNYLDNGTIGNFRFSTDIGTFVQSLCEKDPLTTLLWKCKDEKEATLYLSPNALGGSTFRARGRILWKLAEKGFSWDKNFVIRMTGFPTSDETEITATLQIFTMFEEKVQQDFINGKILKYRDEPNGTAPGPLLVRYIYGPMSIEHTARGGVDGTAGFPLNDPRSGNNGASFYQTFENNQEMVWTFGQPSAQLMALRKYRCELYGDDIYLVLLPAILIHGMLDSGGAFIEDGVEFVGMILGALNFLLTEDISATVSEVLELVRDIDYESIKALYQVLAAMLPPAISYLMDELDAAIGNGGCPARQWYLIGRIGTSIGLAIIPVGAAVKLRTMVVLQKALMRTVGIAKRLKLMPFVSEMGKMLARLDFSDIKTLHNRPDVIERMLTKKKFETYNGFVKSGPYKDAVKFRYHPKYNEARPNANTGTNIIESQYYNQHYASASAVPDRFPFDIKSMFNDGIAKPGFHRATSSDLTDIADIWKRNNLGEQVTINGKQDLRGEIIYVVKQDGTMVISPRRNTKSIPPRSNDSDKIPHPYLSEGDDIIAAGTLKPLYPTGQAEGILPTTWEITNETGHFMVDLESIQPAKKILESLGLQLLP